MWRYYLPASGGTSRSSASLLKQYYSDDPDVIMKPGNEKTVGDATVCGNRGRPNTTEPVAAAATCRAVRRRSCEPVGYSRL